MNLCHKLKVEGRKWRRALTLLEMMVAVTLLAVIMVGLLTMFQYTTRALRVANMQTDVFENARAAVQLVARDLSEMSDFGDTNMAIATPNFLVGLHPGNSLQPPESGSIAVGFVEAFWLTQVNTDWQGTGYFVEGTNIGVGTLYRFTESVHRANVGTLFNVYRTSTNFHRVSDGIVHFVMTPVYATTNGSGQVQYDSLFMRSGNYFSFPYAGNPLPVFIDLEVGVLEPATLKQFNALTNNLPVAQQFLQNQVGKIHFFRERVPIRNFVNPYRADELL